MNGIVVYGGKYGSTKKYAEWIAQKSGFTAMALKETTSGDLAKYDTVVVGGSIKMGKSDAVKWMQKNRTTLTSKTVHLFTVSGAGPDGKDSDKNREAAIPEWLAASASYHAFPGRWNPADGPAFMRWMLNKMAKKETTAGPMTEMARGFDRMDKTSVEPLVEMLR